MDACRVFKHMLEQHSFDFHGVKKALGLDQYGCIRLINHIRTKVRGARPLLLKLCSTAVVMSKATIFSSPCVFSIHHFVLPNNLPPTPTPNPHTATAPHRMPASTPPTNLGGC